MGKYRKKPVVVEADQWFKMRDVPEAHIQPFTPTKADCLQCGGTFDTHGWVQTLEGGHVVCPGDFIIKGIQGEFYPCKADIFEATYDPA